MNDQLPTAETTPARSPWLVAGMAAAAAIAMALVGALFYLAFSGKFSHTESDAAPASAAPALSAGRPGTVNVQLGEMWIRASSATVRAGTVSFTARNVGNAYHDLMIERMPIKMERPGVPMEMAAQGGVEGLRPGITKTTRMNLRPGRYELFCSVPSHFQAGQHGVLDVTGGGRG